MPASAPLRGYCNSWQINPPSHASKGEDDLKIFPTNTNTFQAAVVSGQLTGKIEDRGRQKDIKVSSSQQEFEAFIQSRFDDCFAAEPLKLELTHKR